MSRYLPPAILPWSRAIDRRHTPTAGDYPTYRKCLRWEFGFSCAFCLIHEGDLLIGGVEGWSLMQIEHYILKSKDKSQRNIYKNCFYICERCNKKRGILPIQDEAGNTLLDPCTVAWADHFDRIGDTISPRPGDTSALYTWECYGLDDPPKVRLRERRREWMWKYAEMLVECFELELMLVDNAVDHADDREPAETIEQLDLAQSLRRVRVPLIEKLDEFTPIPQSHDTSCRCGRTDHLSLPDVLAEQTLDLSTLLAQAKENIRGRTLSK